jgi:nicotinate-nucleotide--dimethylbenzimidazole phosphoribosyltransferase
LVTSTAARIDGIDAASIAAAQHAMDRKTKPRGSLGRLEEIAARVAGIRRSASLGPLPPVVVVAAADHGIAAEGISAFPQEVTAQMVRNFVADGAAICVLARRADARLVVVDAGVASDLGALPGVVVRRIGAGTANATRGPAMTTEQAFEALAAGIELADSWVSDGMGLVGLGEMGIGNTTSASAVVAALLAVNPAEVCGRGTGLDDEGLLRKVDAVGRALAANAPAVETAEPVGVLAAVGGFEIGVLSGVALASAAAHVPVVLDGFITGAAALISARIAPACVDSMFASHRSTEPGHAVVLDALGLEPLLDLRLRLGEGSGAALAIPIVNASLALLHEMATFDDAGVTDAGA